MPGIFLSPQQTQSAFTELWDAVRTCELNSLFHRAKARQKARQLALDITTTMLAGIAGIGILSGIKAVPDQVWAIVAFVSGLVGQLRSLLQLTEELLENRRLDSEYNSVLSSLDGDSVKLQSRQRLIA